MAENGRPPAGEGSGGGLSCFSLLWMLNEGDGLIEGGGGGGAGIPCVINFYKKKYK